MRFRCKSFVMAAIFTMFAGLLATPALAEECCQGYCACKDWETGGTYNGCTISYDAQGNITGVQCGYVAIVCC